MTVQEVADKARRTKWAIYTAIREKRGIGLAFERRAGGWFAYAKDVEKYLKGNK